METKTFFAKTEIELGIAKQKGEIAFSSSDECSGEIKIYKRNEINF